VYTYTPISVHLSEFYMNYILHLLARPSNFNSLIQFITKFVNLYF